MTLSDILEYYANLLIIQYRSKEKAIATVKLVVKSLIADNLAIDTRNAYDLETAVGVQLDVIGKWVGVDRFYKGYELERPFFAFTTYDEVSINPLKRGLVEYADWPNADGTGEIMNYNKVLSGTKKLNDDDFRFIIKLKIIQNNINHSHESIDESIFKFFGDTIIPDSDGNMSMVYFVDKDAGLLIQVAVQKDVLPRPLSVKLDTIKKDPDKKFFSFTTYSGEDNKNLSTGFTTYSDFDNSEGEILNYEKII